MSVRYLAPSISSTSNNREATARWLAAPAFHDLARLHNGGLTNEDHEPRADGTSALELLHRIDAYWRPPTTYRSASSISTTIRCLKRVIKKYDLDMFYIAGPGHGGPALVGHTYREGTCSEIYPDISQDEAGLRKLFTQDLPEILNWTRGDPK